MPLVRKHGWESALVMACRSLKMSDQATSLFAADDLIKYHYGQQLLRLRDFQPKSTEPAPRLQELLLFRLLDGNRDLGAGRLAEAIKIVLRTRPLTTSFECLTEVSDELWYKAGDRSTDTTWYTRRGSLAAIYAACEAFQAQDKSRNFRDTESLAKRLLSGLENAEYAEKSIGEWLNFNVRGAFNVLRTWR